MITKSIRCRLDCAVWCEYFKSGECTSPVKCEYQTEHISVKCLETIFFPTEEAWQKLQAENSRLTAENAELRERLEKAVELPYERKRLLWGDKDKETLLCPDCLTDIMGGIGDETFVVQCPNCGCFINSTIEPIEFTSATEARLKELKGDKQ